jgi:hypothetical protein
MLSLAEETAMREDFGCPPHLCSGSGGDMDIPFWLILGLVILLALVLVQLLPPAKDPPPPLKKAVDDVLAGYEKQAVVWDDKKAEAAFREARGKVADVIAKYNNPTPV